MASTTSRYALPRSFAGHVGLRHVTSTFPSFSVTWSESLPSWIGHGAITSRRPGASAFHSATPSRSMNQSKSCASWTITPLPLPSGPLVGDRGGRSRSRPDPIRLLRRGCAAGWAVRRASRSPEPVAAAAPAAGDRRASRSRPRPTALARDEHVLVADPDRPGLAPVDHRRARSARMRSRSARPSAIKLAFLVPGRSMPPSICSTTLVWMVSALPASRSSRCTAG